MGDNVHTSTHANAYPGSIDDVTNNCNCNKDTSENEVVQITEAYKELLDSAFISVEDINALGKLDTTSLPNGKIARVNSTASYYIWSATTKNWTEWKLLDELKVDDRITAKVNDTASSITSTQKTKDDSQDEKIEDLNNQLSTLSSKVDSLKSDNDKTDTAQDTQLNELKENLSNQIEALEATHKADVATLQSTITSQIKDEDTSLKSYVDTSVDNSAHTINDTITAKEAVTNEKIALNASNMVALHNESTKKIEELEAKIDAANETADDAQSKANENATLTESKINTLQSQLTKLIADESTATDNKLSTLSNQIDSKISDQAKANETNLSTLSNQVEDKLTAAKNDLETAINTLRTDTESNFNKTTTKIDDKAKEVSDNVDTKLQALESSLTDKDGELRQSIINQIDSTNQNLSDNVDTLNSKIGTLTDNYTTLSNYVSTSKQDADSKIETLTTQNTNLNREVADLKTQITTLQNTVQSLTTLIDNLQTTNGILVAGDKTISYSNKQIKSDDMADFPTDAKDSNIPTELAIAKAIDRAAPSWKELS